MCGLNKADLQADMILIIHVMKMNVEKAKMRCRKVVLINSQSIVFSCKLISIIHDI